MFSKSVAAGLRTYRNQKVEGLKRSEETEKFCIMLNKLFDALNRKNPRQGVKSTGSDFEVYIF